MRSARPVLWSDPRELRHAGLLGALYFVASWLAISHTRFDGGVALIWIATGILCVDLRHRPDRSWPLRAFACTVASTLSTALFGLGPTAALPLALVNVGEAFVCVAVLERLLPRGRHLESPREIGVLVVVAGIIVPSLSAFPAALIAKLALGVPYLPNWLGWYAGHALGALCIMPLAKLVLGGDAAAWLRKAGRNDRIEALILTFAMTATSVVVFAQHTMPLLFLPFLPLMLTVFRLGRLGAAVSLVILTVVGTVYTARGIGPVNLIEAGPGARVQWRSFPPKRYL